jgi:Transglutaminase-like superfamily
LGHKVQQFRRLPSSERWILLRLGLLVPLLEVCLRRFGFRRVVRWLRRFAVTKKLVPNPAADVERHRRLLFLFHQQVPVAGQCLAGALALWCLLQRRGIETELRFGVRKQEGQLLAHAWIEYGSLPLTLDPELPKYYAALADSIVHTAGAREY